MLLSNRKTSPRDFRNLSVRFGSFSSRFTRMCSQCDVLPIEEAELFSSDCVNKLSLFSSALERGSLEENSSFENLSF